MNKYNTNKTLSNWYHKNGKKGFVDKLESEFKKQPQDAEQRTKDKNIRNKYIKGSV